MKQVLKSTQPDKEGIKKTFVSFIWLNLGKCVELKNFSAIHIITEQKGISMCFVCPCCLL